MSAKITIKVKFEGDFRKALLPLAKINSFAAITNWVAETYNFDGLRNTLLLKYKDEDGDLITMINDGDLQLALSTSDSRLFLHVFRCEASGSRPATPIKRESVAAIHPSNHEEIQPFSSSSQSFNMFEQMIKNAAFRSLTLHLNQPGLSGEEDSHPAFNTRLNQPGAGPLSRAAGPVIRVNIEMFDDGFTVDDSALQPYSDPANIAFMDSLKRRETPPELKLKYGNRPIDVHCFNEKSNSQKLIMSRLKKIQGRAQRSIMLNENETEIPVEFRLPMGQLITGKFNPSMTVADHMRTFVIAADPALASNLFTFFAGFPPKKIDDEGLTIGGAQLNNSVVNVHLLQSYVSTPL
uniref:PB1 domain-containing protein n=1 Tax=Panagrolaimus sp. ES5 TaxID=591445 RepID=A0AC34FT81_9BILA